MEEDLDKTEKQQEQQQPIEKPKKEKPKKERTEKQKEATQKMLLAKKQREDDLRTLRMEREMKEKEKEEKMKEKIQQKIVEKAIKITKKKPVPTKKELLALLSDNDDDDEPEKEIETPIVKNKGTKVPLKPPSDSQGGVRGTYGSLKAKTTTTHATKPPLTIKFI
jgi:hypothetical protein